MNRTLEAYREIIGTPVIQQITALGGRLQGTRVVHVNSTSEGGGVAEILSWMVPLMRELGLDASWEVIRGTPEFFAVTKSIHNGLQGKEVSLTKRDWDRLYEINAENFSKLKDNLEDADIVIIHDPQPAPLIELCSKRKGRWIWRAHIDISRPARSVWRSLRSCVERYDASIFSMNQFAQILPHPQFIIAPSIDPLSEKNMELGQSEVDRVMADHGLDPDRPLLVQVSRFDRFKDPVGVIKTYRLLRNVLPVQLVLAGGGASDDPEGAAILEEVREEAGGDPDIHVLLLPPDAHRTVNALQRLADIIIQKSTREGFGLTVTEGLWKGKPVIGGDIGGIQLQVLNHHTGYLVNTPEGAAHRVRYLLHHPETMRAMGAAAREFVRENFLLTRHLREYLTLFTWVLRGEGHHRIII